MEHPLFLTLAEAIEIHQNQIELYGGKNGLRDLGLLQSALAQPQMTFQGSFFHQDLYVMAAAYAFHISQNQPFIDGNKRTGLAAALVFLEMNGVSINDPKEELFEAMLGFAQKSMNKRTFAEILRVLAG